MLLTLLINNHKPPKGLYYLDNESVFFMNSEWYHSYNIRPSLVVSLWTTTSW